MVVGRSQDTVLCGRADPSREGATILEFSEIFIFLNGGWEVSGYHFAVDAMPVIPHTLKMVVQ